MTLANTDVQANGPEIQQRILVSTILASASDALFARRSCGGSTLSEVGRIQNIFHFIKGVAPRGADKGGHKIIFFSGSGSKITIDKYSS